MYGPNYSGFAFHPKTVRMVGPVLLVDFFGRKAELRGETCFGGASWTRVHIAMLCKIVRPTTVCQRSHRLRQHSVSDRSSGAYPRCGLRRVDGALSPIHCSRHRASACCRGTCPHARFTDASPCSRKQNGVFHVKHAARFLPNARTIKPFSSPTPGMFRSRAGSVPVRLPALPAQTPPFPVHSRSPRSAAPRERSARSAASRRLCRVTR